MQCGDTDKYLMNFRDCNIKYQEKLMHNYYYENTSYEGT